MKIDGSTSAPPMENLEFTAENSLHLLFDKDARGESEGRLLIDKSIPLEASPTNSKTSFCRRKGKEKALSDGHDNDSHETVESCNSVGLFSTGNKRWGIEQQLVVVSKRARKQIQESPASTSLVRQDCSFRNWIANMVKGLNKSDQDEAPPLALTLSHPNHKHTSHDQKIIAYNKSHDHVSRSMGFQTVFQSLYCSDPKEQEARISNVDYQTGGSRELVLADKTCGVNITPMDSHGENEYFSNPFIQSNEKLNESSNGNEVCQPVKPKTSSAIVVRSGDNETSSNIGCSKVKDGKRPSCSSLGELKTSAVCAKGKVNNACYGSDTVGSLWITRFSPKTPGALSNLFHCGQHSSGARENSTDGTRPILHSRNPIDFPVKQNSTGSKDYSTRDSVIAPNTKVSFGLKKINAHNDHNSMLKVHPILPSPKCKSSEPTASMFARRLDALKLHKPSDAIDDANHAMTTCLYCGRRGHDLRECLEIMETERENFVRNIVSFDGEEESPCLCIRCFQHDHWAISCPNRFTASKMQLTITEERHPNMLETKESHSEVPGGDTICSGKNFQVEIDTSLHSKWKGLVSSEKRISYANEVQKLITSSSGDNMVKEKPISYSYNFVGGKLSDVPKGMFDAIKKLRLTRMDILKLMNSDTSLSHLDGFFLRLRLGKWEGGLWGTGYHVAFINGEQSEISSQGRKNPISVSLGGIRCSVESQYISNQDFLEDELMKWWSSTMRNGGKIPSEDHLEVKLEKRKMLGF